VYSLMLFSDWYRWQLVEAFAAAAWVAYSMLLHARLMFGWRGRKLAWFAVALVPLMVGTFWVWSVYPGTYHYFERVLASR
jgi:ABC-type transport system involved in cytochrome c biogenesis permease subunit